MLNCLGTISVRDQYYHKSLGLRKKYGFAAKSSQTGKAVLKLQTEVPGAKVVYSSATGASQPNNLAYMTRLGTCGFADMTQLISQLKL